MLTEKLKTHLVKLQQKKYRKLYSEFIIEGLKGVGEAIKKNADIIFIVVEENYFNKNKIANLILEAEKKGLKIYTCKKNDVNKIKTTTTYPGISAVIKFESFELKDIINKQPIFAFDKISDPGNLGTIIRSATWFGFQNILLSEDSVDPYNDKSVRSTMGSVFSVKIYISDNILNSLKQLKKKGYKIALLDTTGDDLDSMRPLPKTVYLFGSESHGISDGLEKIVDIRYTIKGKGDTESLNVSISASILLSKLK